jgi:predicted transcriptional regulator
MNIPKFLLRGFRRSGTVGQAPFAALGRLEQSVMKEVWRNREMSVRQMTDSLNNRVAYTTVMTTLDRLYKKGLVERRKEGRAFLYAPRFSPEELEQNMATGVISDLLDAENESVKPILACMVDAVSDRDRELLDELERLVRQKRFELEGEE